ncbi:MAG: hypothetical protein GC160_08760 [Acidobacteria bacterium]|nr:hypothetical protein [Acidobacteriota bacterium]
MTRWQRAVCAAVLPALLAATAAAKPFIFYRGVVNAASFAPQGLPNGAVARGSIFTLFGRGLGPAEPATVSAFPLQDSLAGVSIEVCQAGACKAAIPLFVLDRQINAILPSDAPLGRVALRVTFGEEAGNWVPVTVVESSVGLFAVNSAGSGPGITQNFVSQTDQPLNSRRLAARPGQIVTLWGTGLGAGLNADRDAPQPGDLPADVEIYVGGKAVSRRLYAGRSPCCSGVDQLVFEVPADAPLGCYTPVQVRTRGGIVSNAVSMAVSADGSACRDAFNPLVDSLAAGRRTGLLLAQRFDIRLDVDPDPAEPFVTEIALGLLAQSAPSDYFHNQLVLPPAGSCTTQALRGDLFRGRGPNPVAGQPLDAGSELRLSVGGRTVSLTPGPFPQLYAARLSSAAQVASKALLTPGATVSLSATGGPDVTNLSAELTAAAGLNWTSRDELTQVTPGQPLALAWQGGEAGGYAVLWGESYAVSHDASGRFLCLVDAAAGGFTVPGFVTAQLPPTAGRLWTLDAWIALGSLPVAASPASADGLDAAGALFGAWQANSVQVREAADE